MTAATVGRGHNVFKMVSLELPAVISVGKGGKHVVKVIWQFSYGNLPYSDGFWPSLKVKFLVNFL